MNSPVLAFCRNGFLNSVSLNKITPLKDISELYKLVSEASLFGIFFSITDRERNKTLIWFQCDFLL